MSPILIILIITAISLYLYAHTPWGNLQRHLDGIESVSNQLYKEFLENKDFDIKEYEEWEDYLFKGIGSTREDMIDTVKEYRKHIEDIYVLYLKLKEKTKFSSEKERIEIYQDWYDYMIAVDATEVPKEFRKYGGGMIKDETFVDSRAKKEMIEKRFKQKLKD